MGLSTVEVVVREERIEALVGPRLDLLTVHEIISIRLKVPKGDHHLL